MFERTEYKARPGVIVRREKTGGIPAWLFWAVFATVMLSLIGN